MMRSRLRNQVGQAQAGVVLPMVLVAIAIGTVVISAVLGYVGAAAKAGGQDIDALLGLYAAQAGVTNVVTDLIDGKDALSVGYGIPTSTVNDFDVAIVVSAPATGTQPAPLHQYIDPGAEFGLRSLSSQTAHYFRVDNVRAGGDLRVNWSFTPNRQRWRIRLYEGTGPPGAPAPVTIAADNFESSTFSGGTGSWAFDWSPTGNATTTATGGPFEGTFHLRLTGSDEIRRAASSTLPNQRIQFWAKAESFEAGETATMSVSTNGIDFTTVRTWVQAEADGVYRFEDIDVASFGTSTEFWILFQANTSGVGDLFFVDDLKIISQALSSPIAEHSDTKGPGALLVDGSVITGGAYTIEFYNNSGTDLVSGTFSASGSGAETWVFTQAHRDYVIYATAASSTGTTFVRQIPGPTEPRTGQKTYIYTWKPYANE